MSFREQMLMSALAPKLPGAPPGLTPAAPPCWAFPCSPGLPAGGGAHATWGRGRRGSRMSHPGVWKGRTLSLWGPECLKMGAPWPKVRVFRMAPAGHPTGGAS